MLFLIHIENSYIKLECSVLKIEDSDKEFLAIDSSKNE